MSQIYSKDFFIYFEIQETLNYRIYILLMMIGVHLALGLDLYTS